MDPTVVAGPNLDRIRELWACVGLNEKAYPAGPGNAATQES
jgi:hypothetical protein